MHFESGLCDFFSIFGKRFKNHEMEASFETLLLSQKKLPFRDF